MSRTREFDEDEVLGAAMELFWRRGYEATSTADLLAHLGIARASLYNTFGSKHELYLRAIDRYKTVGQPIVEPLSRPGPALPIVREFVESWANDTVCDPQRRGCLITNAAVERMTDDPEVARRVESSWQTVEVALTSTLLRAKAQGELAGEADPRALARFLLVFLQGIRVLGRADPDRERLRDAVRQALSILG